MDKNTKKFKKAYVVQNTGHDFSSLLALAEELVFVTTGYEEEDTIYTTVVKNLIAFNPKTDLMVPVGNVFINMVAGTLLGEMCVLERQYHVALFRDKAYHVRAIQVNSPIFLKEEE